MPSLTDIWSTFALTLTSIGVAGLVILGEALLQIVLRYSLPDLGYYRRTHGRDVTFFIRNLDAVEYRQPLVVRVIGKAMIYVTVEAGPWCVDDPVREEVAGMDAIKLMFTGIPEDGVFIVRARATLGEVNMALHPDSVLKSRRSFDREIPPFGAQTIATYYLTRYLAGVAAFFVIFIGSIVVRNDSQLRIGDATVGALGIFVSVVAFLLVVPFKGKRTIGGYESGLSIGRCWPNPEAVVNALDEDLQPPAPVASLSKPPRI